MAQPKQHKTVEELRDVAMRLTHKDLQLIVALYGLGMAQSVAIDMIQGNVPVELLTDTISGDSLVEDAIEFVTELVSKEAITNHVSELKLSALFDINVAIKTMVFATLA